MSEQDNWGGYGDDDIRWPRQFEPSGWGCRASALACGCTPDRECPRCNGADVEALERWTDDKATEKETVQARRLGRPLTQVERDRIWLSCVPRRLRDEWAADLEAARDIPDYAEEATA